MARHVRVVVVCEDLLHETFARAFLMRRGLHRREMTFVPAPPGKGDAKQHVCEAVCKELRALRRFPGERRALVYVIDADRLDGLDRLRHVEETCRRTGVDPPGAHEAVFGFVPKWEIENWLAYLRGDVVNEDSNRYDKYQNREAEVYPLVERLAGMCERQELPLAPPSLILACSEYSRLRNWIKND